MGEKEDRSNYCGREQFSLLTQSQQGGLAGVTEIVTFDATWRGRSIERSQQAKLILHSYYSIRIL
jgi:hypothetical protein